MPEPDRRERLLEAAADLVSAEGLGAVTHRSVEKATGLPHGSVTYYFGSRDGLISGLVEWLCAKSEERARALATAFQAQVDQGLAPDLDALAAGLLAWHDAEVASHLARMELELQGAREPAQAERMTQAAQAFWDICGAVAATQGSTHPMRDGRVIAAMLDGILFDRLTHPGQGPEVAETALRWILRGAGEGREA